MPYGLCNHSVIPMRSEPSDRAEMTNQVLFGESCRILEKRKKWSRIRLTHDGYEGWVDNKQIQPCSDEFFKELKPTSPPIASELIELITDTSSGLFFPILLGSHLPMLKDGQVKLDEMTFNYEGPSVNPEVDRQVLIDCSYKYLNAPYLWGGRSPFGIDCSGFTQMSYRMAGYQLPRDSHEQANHGTTLSFIEESEPGDLAFFDNNEGQIIHVGIILENNYILHASGKVRLDRLDQTGIFNNDIGTHTHKLRVIKKIIE